ncbi:MAG: hypothetical protein ISS35_02445 [Kiritimatiellae bacterium]|nr:hypothetical protein [Kiritimatiellia bacterium]
MAQDWDIKSRGSQCSQCEKQFEDLESYYALLTFGEEGYERKDYCQPCWKLEDRENQAFSTWKGTFRLPPAKAEEPLQKENAESLLRRLLEDDPEEHVNVIYILAVMLERKKLLDEKDVRMSEDTTLRIYEHKKTGETFVVRDPHLRLDELEHVQQSVIDLLDGGEKEDNSDNEPTPDQKSDESAG